MYNRISYETTIHTVTDVHEVLEITDVRQVSQAYENMHEKVQIKNRTNVSKLTYESLKCLPIESVSQGDSAQSSSRT